MDLKDIHYIHAIIENGRLSKAAQQLFITQPALSQALHKIERELNAVLFERSSSGLIPTPLALFIEKEGFPLVKKFEYFQREVLQYQQKSEKKLTFGISQFYGRHYLTSILNSFQIFIPDYKIEVLEGESHFLEEELLKGTLDIAFYPISTSHESLQVYPVKEEEIFLAIPNTDHEAIKDLCRHFSLEKLSSKPFILMQQGFKLRILADELCREANFIPHIALESQNLDTCLSLVAHGYGLSFLPDILKQEDSSKLVTFLSLGNTKKFRSLALVCTPQKEKQYTISKVAEHLAQHFISFSLSHTLPQQKS